VGESGRIAIACDETLKPPIRPRPKPNVVVGFELRHKLGFATERAFQRWRQLGGGGIRFYPIPGQSRGVYARRDELEAFLATNLRPGRAGGDTPDA